MATYYDEIAFTHIRYPEEVQLLAPSDVPERLAHSPEEAALLDSMPGLRRFIAQVYNTLATGDTVMIASPLYDPPPSSRLRLRTSRAQSRERVRHLLTLAPTISLSALARATGLSRSYVCKLRQEVRGSDAGEARLP